MPVFIAIHLSPCLAVSVLMCVYWCPEIAGSSVFHQRLTLKTRYGSWRQMLQRERERERERAALTKQSPLFAFAMCMLRRLNDRPPPVYLTGVVHSCYKHKKVQLAHTRLPRVGFRSWSRLLAVSLQVTWVINPAVGCHYFPPGPQLPPQPLRGLLPISLLGEQRHSGCEQFA